MKHAPLRGLRCLPRDRTGTSSATTPVFFPDIRHPTGVGVLPVQSALFTHAHATTNTTQMTASTAWNRLRVSVTTRARPGPIFFGGAWEAAPDIESTTRKTLRRHAGTVGPRPQHPKDSPGPAPEIRSRFPAAEDRC